MPNGQSTIKTRGFFIMTAGLSVPNIKSENAWKWINRGEKRCTENQYRKKTLSLLKYTECYRIWNLMTVYNKVALKVTGNWEQ